MGMKPPCGFFLALALMALLVGALGIADPALAATPLVPE